MGWQQRSEQRARVGQRCYLCMNPILDGEPSNRDHVPPKQIFASSIRKEFSPQLAVLPTHVKCNASFQKDEEYFVYSFVGHVQTPTADAVFNDIREATRKGRNVGLLKDVVSRFGKVQGPNGERLYTFDGQRVQRFLKKVVRGLYTIETSQMLPEGTLTEVHLAPPKDPGPTLESLRWFEAVRDTEPLARYGRVFDYKWIGWKDGELRGHAVAMMFWDGLIAATLFHDPACTCVHCRQR